MGRDRSNIAGEAGALSYPWQQSAREAFANCVREDRIPHAILLAGPSGCGKTEFAYRIAREALCLNSQRGGCGECRSCQLLKGGAHPDFRQITFELQEKSEKFSDVIKVPQIRRLIEALYKTTTISNRKVAIVHPAERMNASAANALLKTLEEPVGDTVLILVAHDPARLPATVRSRCQRLSIDLPTKAQSLDWLTRAQGVDAVDAEEALEAAAGRPLHALALIENGIVGQYRATIQALDDLRNGSTSDGRAAAQMNDFDPELLWTWLSLKCSSVMRHALLGDIPGQAARQLNTLQKLADRNRVLAATPVRKDFLLRDWLIQWQKLPATLPLDRQTQET